MEDRVWDFFANATAQAANAFKNATAAVVNYTENTAVPAIRNATAAIVNYIENTAVPSIRNATASSGAREVIMVAGCAMVGVVALSCLGMFVLQCCMGFRSIGPRPGSYASSWMSGIAISSGRVVAGSLFSLIQAATMSGGFLLRSPKLLALGAIGGGLIWVSLKY